MENIAQFKSTLERLKSDKETQIKHFMAQHAADDAKFAKIELNIIDIFEKMLQASERQVPPNAANYLEALSNVYMSYFEKIPQNWREHLSECETFGDIEGAHIERLKLKQADGIRLAFTELIKEHAND